jgi:hypothetical protein
VTGTPADGPGDHVLGNVHFEPWLVEGTIYEHAEDGDTLGWTVYDNTPGGATVSNIYDTDRGSQVIETSGFSILNGYELRNEDGSNWQNSIPDTEQAIFEWSMRCSEEIRIFVELETNAGPRYLYYSTVDPDNGPNPSGEYVHHGLGSDTKDDQWHTFARDLVADLHEFQSGVNISKVNGLYIRGSVRLDDIRLVKTDFAVSVSDVTVNEEAGSAVLAISADGATPPCRSIAVEYITSDNTAYAASDYESSPGIATIDADTSSVNVSVPLINDDFKEVAESFSLDLKYAISARISDGTGVATINADNDPILIKEDAEDGETLGWIVYDNTPPGAEITNLYDTEHDSRVIEHSGFYTYNGYHYEEGNPWNNTTHFVIEWSMTCVGERRVFVDVETNVGQRYLYYSTVDTSYGVMGSGGEYVHHHLGSDKMDGEWHTFTRDLQEDLDVLGETISAVNSIYMRGTGRVDDIRLMPAGPGLSINDITASEGTAAVFTITSSKTDGSDITVHYATNDDTADSPADYLSSSGTATILPGNTEVDVSVTIIDDSPKVEGDEAFYVILTDASSNALIRDNIGWASISPNDPPAGHTVYENAEDGDTLGWLVYDNDPAGATISNVNDTDRGSRVITLSGDGTDNGYELRSEDGSDWLNTTQTHFYWAMRCSEEMRIFVDMQTDAGHRVLYYSMVDTDDGASPSGEYVHHGLGSDRIDGEWHTYVRDLQADLNEFQPGVIISEVNGLYIRGSASLDYITLY